MSEKQAKFLELVKLLEKLKEETNSVREKLESVMAEIGYEYIQDPETLTVYKILEPKGVFVFYRKIDYVRTALEGERAGTLSLKEAESKGFTVK